VNFPILLRQLVIVFRKIILSQVAISTIEVWDGEYFLEEGISKLN
jgi:hypothetical protein